MKRFKRIYLEITNVCNLRCSYCPVTRRKPEYMDIDSFNNILDQIKPFTDYVYFHVKGEPFMHPKLGAFLDICNEKGFKVNITTNGTLINQVKDVLINKQALRQVNFSLHSIEENCAISRREYINSILSFVKESNEKSDIIISLRLWNLNEDNEINKKSNRNREILELIENEFNLPYRIEEKVQPGRGIKIKERVYLNQDHVFKWPSLDEEEDNGIGTCYGLSTQLAILVDGTVIPCCLDGEGVIALGNIKQTGLSQILESARVMNIIKGFNERKAVEELCRKCGYRKRFG